MTAAHLPVLCPEAVDALVKPGREDGFYVDATFGRGGHARAILDVLGADGQLLVIDRDVEAVAMARSWAVADARVSVCHDSFENLSTVIERAVDGVLMDLGVSSPQLDEPARGFSYLREGPLDMRMNQTVGPTAAEWLNDAPASEIEHVLREYGEERFARRIAAAIVSARPLHTTTDLVSAVRAGQPVATPGKHDATRTFQAVRMRVNDEVGQLERGLQGAFASLAPGGRLVVISFHSLEDRIVKRYFKAQSQPAALPRRLPIRGSQTDRPARIVGKPLRATAAEQRTNPRARSATLRVLERRG